jgi:hypothetical protein
MAIVTHKSERTSTSKIRKQTSIIDNLCKIPQQQARHFISPVNVAQVFVCGAKHGEHMVPSGSVIIGVCVVLVGVGMGVSLGAAAAILMRVVRSGCQGRGDAVLAGHEEHQLAPGLCSRVLLR